MWFSRRKPADTTTPASPAPTTSPPGTSGSDADEVIRKVHLAFSALLVGAPAAQERPVTAEESVALQALAQAAQAPKTIDALPRLPATLPRLLSLLRAEDASTVELTDLLSTDPVLLGDVIRIANTPYYRSARQIHSVADALQVLGLIGLQQVVVRVALRPVFGGNHGRISKSAGIRLWALAERCAHGSAWLRSNWGDPFEGYLAGMAANAGMIAVLRIVDQLPAWAAPPASAQFLRSLRDTGLALNAPLARAWSFPPAVVDAMESLARETSQPHATLAASVACADRVARSLLLEDAGVLPEPQLDDDEPATACRVELLSRFAPG